MDSYDELPDLYVFSGIMTKKFNFDICGSQENTKGEAKMTLGNESSLFQIGRDDKY